MVKVRGVQVAATLAVGTFVTIASAQSRARSMPTPPPLPVFEWNACPFEGCTYRAWKAENKIALYDTWNKSRRQIGQLSAGDKVVALTGVVITFKPGIVRLDRDASKSQAGYDFKRGDTVLTYASHGEGVTTAWLKGQYDENFDTTAVENTTVERGRKEWWAKVRLRSGTTAWVWMDNAHFSGIDALG
jgi:hypothetical protein